VPTSTSCATPRWPGPTTSENATRNEVVDY
jgi:hypothetical protein